MCDLTITDKITMYDGDVLIWGTEPDGTKPDKTKPVTTTTATTTTTTQTTTTTITSSSDATTTSMTGSTISDSTISTEKKPTPAVLYGDITLDGVVNLLDTITLNKALAHVVQLSDTANSSADVNLDNNVSDEDASLLMQYVILIIPSLPYTE